jgi:hypothetical protein
MQQTCDALSDAVKSTRTGGCNNERTEGAGQAKYADDDVNQVVEEKVQQYQHAHCK